MKLHFFGPLGRVTGSCALLSDDRLGVRILVDAGMQQAEGDADKWNRGELPFDASTLTHVVLTHAHIDHCGLLPRVFKEGFTGKVLCTPETAALAQIELEDSAKVSGAYSFDDARRVRFDARETFGFGGYFKIARDVFLQFFRTSHILGAVSVRVSWGPKGTDQRSIMFSGDLGTNVDGHERFLLLGHRMAPQPSTYAVVESTYGDRPRTGAIETFEGRTQNLARELKLARERGGTTLIASFAMDRLQTLMLDLAYLAARDPELAATRTLIHAPLGKKVSSVYARFVRAKDVRPTGVRSRWVSKSAFARFGLDPESVEDEQKLEDAIVSVLDPNAAPSRVVPGLLRVHEWTDRRRFGEGPDIVLSSSGMLEGGPVAEYLPDVLADSCSTLLLPGYASPTTVAGKLLALGPLLPAQRERLSGISSSATARRCSRNTSGHASPRLADTPATRTGAVSSTGSSTSAKASAASRATPSSSSTATTSHARACDARCSRRLRALGSCFHRRSRTPSISTGPQRRVRQRRSGPRTRRSARSSRG